MSQANDYISQMTGRYVYAATRFLPGKQRKDAQLELSSLIGDMLEERTAGRAAVEKDIDVVLTELGRPGSFFSKSAGEESYLIGPQLYSCYRQVVCILLAAQAGGITIATLVLTLLGSYSGWGSVWFWVSALVSSTFVGWGFVTLLFSLAQWRGGKLKANLSHRPWNLADLPTVPANREKISQTESIVNIVFTVLAMLLFTVFSNYFAANITLGGTNAHLVIPLFEEANLRAALPFILGSFLIAIAREVFCLLEGRYTRRLAIVTVGADVLSLACWCVALLVYPIFNTAFTMNLVTVLPELAPVIWVFANLPQVFLGILIFAHFLDCTTSIWRAWRYDRNG